MNSQGVARCQHTPARFRFQIALVLLCGIVAPTLGDTLVHTTATLSNSRYGLAATSVGDKALFAGGRGGRPTFADATSLVDIYNATTGAWSTASMSSPRFFFDAVTVGNLAIFAGGMDASGRDVRTMDIYDGSTGAWSSAPFPVSNYGMYATGV